MADERYGRIPRELLRDPSVTDRAARLYAYLDDYAYPKAAAWPSRALMAKELGCSESSIDRALAVLEAGGWIRREPRFRPSDGGRTSDLCILLHLQPPLVTGDEGGSHGRRVASSPVMRPPSSPVTTQEGTPTEGTPEKKNIEADRFDEFWSLYPRRKAKESARNAWSKALTRADADTILQSLPTFTRSVSDLKFCPYPATWLNGERWADEQESSQTPDSYYEHNDGPARVLSPDEWERTGRPSVTGSLIAPDRQERPA